jgi:ANTAR domain
MDRVIPSFTSPDQDLAQTPSAQTADNARNLTLVSTGAGESRPWDAGRLQAARLEFDAQARRFEQAKAQLQATIDRVRNGRPQREILHDSAFARLQARLESMPVIEQAKGIMMAQQRCGPDEAFDLLRRASQRANIKVSVLAAQIVEQVASPGSVGGANRARPAANA